jgi:hypothetical protein
VTDILSRNASSGIRPQEFRHTTVWSETVPRPSINEAPMTGAERLASYRATRAAGVPVIRLRCPADRRSRFRIGMTPSQGSSYFRSSTLHCSKPCWTINKTAAPQRPCGQLSISTSPNSRRSHLRGVGRA